MARTMTSSIRIAGTRIMPFTHTMKGIVMAATPGIMMRVMVGAMAHVMIRILLAVMLRCIHSY